MATIYEGTERNQQQVDERIDPEILRALGLSDVSDLDYDEYKTLLKERLAANRMNTSQKAREDSARLDEKILNEFKRVKAETGRFRVRNERVSYQKMLPGTANGGGGGLVQNITFQQQPGQEEGEDETQSQVQGLNDFLANVVAPSLSKIESSLLSILENLTGQQKAEEKAASSARIAGQKAQKRAKENRFEGLGLMASKAMNVAKKVFSPLSQIFGAIFNFLSNVLTGFLVLKVLDWIKDPRKLFVDIGNMFIMFLNAGLKLMFGLMFAPFNAFIAGLNSGINLFEEAVNNTIGRIPGIPPLELPEIPPIEPPQIPMIPYPKEENEEPNKQQKTPKVPAMAEGGPVTNIYNIMSDGGQVRTDTGQKVTGAGPDTQLVALQPGEFVMSKGAVDTFGLDTMMDMNSMGGGTNKPKMARVQSVNGGGSVMAMQGGGSVVEHLHGEPGRAGYRADHGTIKDAHDHYAFSSEALRKYVQNQLAAGGGPSGRKYQIGSTTGGKHAATSYHYAGQAFDIPWSQFGSGKITQKDFQQSRQLDKDVRALVAQYNGQETEVNPKNTATGQDRKTPSKKSKDYWALVAISSVESGVAQGRADVATSIMNRAASGGVYAGSPSIHALVNAKNQYQPVRRGDPQLWAQIKDKQSAIAAVNSVPYARGMGKQFIEDTMAVLSNQQMMADAAKFVGPRTDFSTPKTMNGPNQSHAKYRSTHRDKEVSRHNHIFGFFVGPGAVALGTKRFGAGTGAASMQQMNLSSGEMSPESPQQPGQPGQPGQSSQVSSMPGSTDTQYTKTPYAGGDLPMVSPGLMNKTPPPPPSRSGSGGQVPPVLVPKEDTSTSSTSSQGSTSPMFSPLDMSNPDLIVVKAIYNIVG